MDEALREQHRTYHKVGNEDAEYALYYAGAEILTITRKIQMTNVIRINVGALSGSGGHTFYCDDVVVAASYIRP